MSTSKENPIYIVALALWLLIIATGMWFLYDYQNKAGSLNRSIKKWPVKSEIAFVENKKNLLMFVHPHCPCSTASLSELKKIVSKQYPRLDIKIIFAQINKKTKTWVTESKLYQDAKKAKIKTLIDQNRTESKRFAAASSGLVMIFDENKKLIFRGGITESRGHEGDNKGLDIVFDVIQNGSKTTKEFFVFGCPIQDHV